jgi:hypothetical protein
VSARLWTLRGAMPDTLRFSALINVGVTHAQPADPFGYIISKYLIYREQRECVFERGGIEIDYLFSVFFISPFLIFPPLAYGIYEVQCGTDSTPSDGSGCDNGPATINVCGTCGILYDVVYPIIV